MLSLGMVFVSNVWKVCFNVFIHAMLQGYVVLTNEAIIYAIASFYGLKNEGYKYAKFLMYQTVTQTDTICLRKT